VGQLEIVVMTARVIGWCLGLSEGAKVDEETVMS
jgi:hypothetical protein